MRTLLRTARFMSTSTGPAYQATTPMRPPRLTFSSASCIDPGPPAHSRTEPAPLPIVISLPPHPTLQRPRAPRALEDGVGALAHRDLAHPRPQLFPPHVDHEVGAQPPADL